MNVVGLILKVDVRFDIGYLEVDFNDILKIYGASPSVCHVCIA